MNLETPISFTGQLNSGYYKVVATSGVVNVSYSNGFTDVSYNFYNLLGQLIASVPPNGVKLLEGTGYTNYSTLASVPYVNLFNYDTRGRLVSSSSPDKGLSGCSIIAWTVVSSGSPRMPTVRRQEASAFIIMTQYVRPHPVRRLHPGNRGCHLRQFGNDGYIRNYRPMGRPDQWYHDGCQPKQLRSDRQYV